jgi:hypothetical protein
VVVLVVVAQDVPHLVHQRGQQVHAALLALVARLRDMAILFKERRTEGSAQGPIRTPGQMSHDTFSEEPGE